MITIISKNKDDCPDRFEDEKGIFYTFKEIVKLIKSNNINFETKKGGKIIFIEDKNNCDGEGYLGTINNGIKKDNLDEVKTESFKYLYKDLTS